MAAEKRIVYEFGGFALDAGRRVLARETGEPIALTAKVLDTLLYLVEHRGETLDKDTLLRAIWPELVVEENNLTQNISTLRQVLGEARGENRFIATVPRKGYRFVAEVVERDAPAGTTAAATGRAAVSSKPRRTLWTVLALGAAVLVASLVWWRPRSGPVSPPPT